MAKTKKITASKVDAMQKKGRGLGHGVEYTPWFTVRDVPSIGLSTRVLGWKTGRIHHFLSQLESSYFYTLEWSLAVTDIREHLPMDVEETVKIADRLGITHPLDPDTKEPIVMTTDFVLNVLDNETTCLVARTVLPNSELNSKRRVEKLEIERVYWNEQGVNWGIVTDQEIPEGLVKNIVWVHEMFHLDELVGFSEAMINQIEPKLYEAICASELSLSEATRWVDDRLGFDPGTSLTICRHLIANRRWIVDMITKINPSNQLVIRERITEKDQLSMKEGYVS
ncbi:TnsA endonuclease C-terminal domain-containing protein [Brevibacillus centrosporus]|uniref:TnsA endonuclease C-terminal domain-containing protein n=1 Tax=Brevibacillus centrosporus TaxID=54910 RepID=UPI003B026BC0